MSEASHRTWAEIDRGALLHNVRALRSRLPSEARIMAIVKANAYGHGLDLVAPALVGAVEMFGVANLQEALELRELIPPSAILLLSPALPGEREAIVREGLIPAVSTFAEAQAYSACAVREGVVAPVHLAIDTGMGRIGVWEEDAPALAHAIAALQGLKLTGLASHLPVADEDEAYTRAQLARFARIVSNFRESGLSACTVHVENSAGALAFPESAGDFIRAGLALYGSSPLPEFQSELRAVLTWKTRITLLREVEAGRSLSYGRTYITDAPARIATLAVGYADGYRRHLRQGETSVLIRGQRCPLRGRVTMDQILVDVTALPGLETGEEVVLLGRQGSEEILASEMAAGAGTIAWDIFTGLGSRVHRMGR